MSTSRGARRWASVTAAAGLVPMGLLVALIAPAGSSVINLGHCQQLVQPDGTNQAPGQTGNGPWAPGKADYTPGGFDGAEGCTQV